MLAWILAGSAVGIGGLAALLLSRSKYRVAEPKSNYEAIRDKLIFRKKKVEDGVVYEEDDCSESDGSLTISNLPQIALSLVALVIMLSVTGQLMQTISENPGEYGFATSQLAGNYTSSIGVVMQALPTVGTILTGILVIGVLVSCFMMGR